MGQVGSRVAGGAKVVHLIVGASGVLGSRLAVRLLDAGERVRVVSRDPERVSDLVARGAEVSRGDLLDQAWFATALHDVGRVVIASHGLVPPSRRNTPAAVDGTGARGLIDAAAAAGVQQVVYVSAAGAAHERTVFGRVKRASERHLEASGVPWTVVRPSVFPENHALVFMGEPLRAGKAVPFFGRGTEKLNWVSASDVADDIVRVLQDATTLGTVRELRGIDHRSRSEVLGILERELGVRAKRQHLPVPVVKVARSVTRSVHPGVAALLDMAIDEIDRGGDSADEAERATVVGTTTVEDVVRAWVAEGRATAT